MNALSHLAVLSVIFCGCDQKAQKPEVTPAVARTPTPLPAPPPTPPPQQQRANGRGFTLALPAGWRVFGVDPAREFTAKRESPHVSLFVFPSEAGVVDAADCKVWAGEFAADISGKVLSHEVGTAPFGKTCTVEIQTESMWFRNVVIETPAGSHIAKCGTDPTEIETARKMCAEIIASWRDDASSVPTAADERLTIKADNGRTQVRGPQFSVAFPDDWEVREQEGFSLVGATKEGGIMMLAYLDTTFDELGTGPCDFLAKHAGEAFHSDVVGHELTKVADRLTCRIQLRRGASSSYVLYFRKATKQLFEFICAHTAGPAPKECDKAIASLRVEP